MDISNATAARCGLMCMHAMDAYRVDTANLAPPLAAALVDQGWQLLGHIIGKDRLPLGPDPGVQVCYGYLARNGTEVVAAFRGTDHYREWVTDAVFFPAAYAPLIQPPVAPPGGMVEGGFWSVYKSMTLVPVGGTPGALANTVAGLVPDGCTVMVVGHSLGAPLGNYLALELARGALGDRASGCFFASPRPGNAAFAEYFDKTVASYRVFDYILDLVPQVPAGPDYTPLPRRTIIRPATAESIIELGLGCNHHVICYSAMLDYELTAPFVAAPPPGEAGSASCVLGPEAGRQSLAKLLLAGIGRALHD